jgi:hypothetical protein
VNNNYLDLGMSKSGFIHTLPGGRLNRRKTATSHALSVCLSVLL